MVSDDPVAYSQDTLHQATDEILSVGQVLDARGWTPATSGNFSRRLDERHCAITASGASKGSLTPDDVLVVDLDGRAAPPRRPSAETLLHTRIYARSPAVGAVLHSHSMSATLVSRLTDGDRLRFAGYELQKAFTGVATHESELAFPVFENTQDMTELAAEVDAYRAAHEACWGYLIRGHGAYTWGATMRDALRHLEALDFLASCELQLMHLRGRS